MLLALIVYKGCTSNFRKALTARLLQGPESCPISNPLSRTAATMTLEEVEAAMRAKQGHTMHLTDVAPGTDLHPFFLR